MAIMRIHNKQTQYTHEILWVACLKQKAIADQGGAEHIYFNLTTMLMAYFAFEGYLNFIGVILCPDEWRCEKEFFSRDPYQGIKGKIKLLAHAVHIADVHTLPEFQTIMFLRELRSYVVHAKLHEYEETLEHRGEGLPPPKLSPFAQKVQNNHMHRAVNHVELFCNLFQENAAKVSDKDEFQSPALGGSLGFGSGDVEMIPEE
ncbi:MAG: hypothetical protein WAX69_12355 [Victivallales bacterium]